MTECNLEPVKEENIVECRACLQEINSYSTFYNLFDCIEQMGSTIAEKLSNITQVQISESDELPKVICEMCYTLLQSAYSFTMTVRNADRLLRQKFVHVNQKEWPKPIQISSNIENACIPHMEIKEEVLSEAESLANNKGSNDNFDLEIKHEPTVQEECDFNRPKINGVCSLNDMDIEYLDSPSSYGDVASQENTTIKEEPLSTEEMESIENDLSLECMLCTKIFNSVSGLKAHVITQHSYKGVKRKSDNTVSPQKAKQIYICQICKRAFTTSTDLMVHETCHNKSKCYICSQSFSTFAELSQHRLTCVQISQNNTVVYEPPKLKSTEELPIQKSKTQASKKMFIVDLQQPDTIESPTPKNITNIPKPLNINR